MQNKIKPFISSRNRIDILADFAFEHTSRVNSSVSGLIAKGMNLNIPKLDGKAGASDGGASGFWDKKDGKEGKEGKDGKDGKDSKEGKDGKDDKEGKDQKDSKEDKEDKEDKDGKDGSGDAGKTGDESDNFFRYGDEVVLPLEDFSVISQMFNVRLTSLLNQAIF
jgi:hypothetical protein